MKIAVIGQGYVGLPLALAAWNAGYDVIGFDIDERKIQMLNLARSPIEDVTDDDVRAMMSPTGDDYTIRYQPTTNPAFLKGSDVFVVTVPTPLKDGEPDLSAVMAAGVTIAPYLYSGALVVLESTVAPGTTENEFAASIRYARGYNPGKDYMLAFSPERVDPGNKVWNIENTPKLVAGYDTESLNLAVEFYESMCDVVVPIDDLKTAEMAKLLENTFRHVNIALVNELARAAHRMRIDFRAAVKAAATKPYGFMEFTPGPGVGGHCLPIDPVYLNHRVDKELGIDLGFVKLAMQINKEQPSYVVNRAMLALNDRGEAVRGSNVLILGYAYKANTADARETPAQAIVEGLKTLGAHVAVCDPTAKLPDSVIEYTMDELDYLCTWLAEGKRPVASIPNYFPDLVILVTDHKVFEKYYEVLGSNSYQFPFLDTRGVAEGTAVEKL